MKPELIKFVAGTKAKASEVNENFDKLLNYVIEAEENDVSVYKPDQEFEYGKYVLGEVDGIVGIYKSVAEENKGNPLTDENYWVKVDLLNDLVTNCITEIPQRIKLELNNGNLILKAGSEIIVPNGKNTDGSLKFDYVAVESDADWYPSSTAGTRFAYYNTTLDRLSNSVTQHTYSGNTATMNGVTPQAYIYFYNTETNKMYNGSGGAWTEVAISLPVCLFTNDTNAKATSIDQVFNGMGYIGSTVWVDKGVKGLIPNGRNEDGTLNNVEFVTPRVFVDESVVDTRALYVNAYGVGDGSVVYNDVENLNYWGTNVSASCITGYVFVENKRITSFQPKLPFRAVDYNEFVEVKKTTLGRPDYSSITAFSAYGNYTPAYDCLFISYRSSWSESAYLKVKIGDTEILGNETGNYPGRSDKIVLILTKGTTFNITTNGTNYTSYIVPLK